MVLFLDSQSKKQRKDPIKYLQLNKIEKSLLQQQNMRPYIFSKNNYIKYGTGWQQGGTNVTIQPKKLRYDFIYEKIKVRQFYKLTFQYQFESQNDEIFFAYSIPYTYSFLLKQLSQLKQKLNENIQVSNNGYSLMGLPIPIIKITDRQVKQQNKKIVFATGRIHPGESNGSIVMSGFLKFLCSKEAEQIRKKTIFIIIPMVNPDGVILGNYRTSLIGKDLNREYCNTNFEQFPEILNIKNLITNILKVKKQIHMFLDFHGHSQKKNAFVYGPSYAITNPEYFKCKLLPKLISMKTQMFRYYSSIFRISQSKKSTGRAVMFEEYHIPYTYTIQTSNGFYYDSTQLNILQFNRQKWLELGNKIGKGCAQYFTLIQEYEELINQKRQMKSRQKQRGKNSEQKRKLQKRSRKKTQFQFIQSEQNEKGEQKYNQATAFLLSILQQIKLQNFQKKMNDEDIEKQSDSGDEKDQMQPLKMAQLKKIIKSVQQNQKINKPAKSELSQSPNKQKTFKFKSKKMTQKIQIQKPIYTKLENQLVEIQSEIFNKIEKPQSSENKRNISLQRFDKKDSQQDDNLIDFQQLKNFQNRKSQLSLKRDNDFQDNAHLEQERKSFQVKKNKSGVKPSSARFQQIQSVQTYRPINIPKKKTQKDHITVKTHTHNFQTDVVFANYKSQRKQINKNSRKNIFTRSDKKKNKKTIDKPTSQRKNQDMIEQSSKTNKLKNTIRLQKKQYDQSNILRVNFTKLLYMINSESIEDNENNTQALNSKSLYPTAFYRIKQQIQTKKNLTNYQKQDPIPSKFVIVNNDYLKIKKYQ